MHGSFSWVSLARWYLLPSMPPRPRAPEPAPEARRRPEFVWPADVPEDAIASVFSVRAEHAGHRLDRWLSLELPRLTRSRAQAIVTDWAYDPSARRLRPSHRVRPGEVIVVFRARWQEPEAPRDVAVLHADAHLVAVDKPSGLPVHPTARFHQNTLTAVLAEKFPGERVVLAHRLDRETSGVLLAARTHESERALKQSFADRAVHKTYQAIVHGVVAEDRFTIDAPLALDGGEVSVRMCVRPESKGGAPSVTRVEVLERLDGFTRVAAHPETGRQHQIRVHLAHAGFPIVGDKLYAHGDEVFLQCIDAPPDDELLGRLLLPRHALHAFAITFEHPAEARTMRLEAPLPADMAAFCAARR